MRLFRFPKRDSRYADEESTGMRILRYLIIIVLFCGVFWGFWMNNQRRMDMLKKPATVRIDSTGSLSEEQQGVLAEYAERFRKTYGVSLVLNIRDQSLPEPYLSEQEKGGTILLGLSPPNRQVVFELPPLAQAALGEPVVLYLRHAHFMPYFMEGSWPEGLQSALNLLSRRLDAALLANGAQSG